MKTMFSGAKRILALVLALLLMVPAMSHAHAHEHEHSVSIGHLMAEQYTDLSDAEKNLLNSGLLNEGAPIEFEGPTNEDDLVSVNTGSKLITAEGFTDEHGNVWVVENARIVVNEVVEETVAMSPDGNGNFTGNYTYPGNAFSVVVHYCLDVTIDTLRQNLLFSGMYALNQGYTAMGLAVTLKDQLLAEDETPDVIDTPAEGLDELAEITIVKNGDEYSIETGLDAMVAQNTGLKLTLSEEAALAILDLQAQWEDRELDLVSVITASGDYAKTEAFVNGTVIDILDEMNELQSSFSAIEAGLTEIYTTKLTEGAMSTLQWLSTMGLVTAEQVAEVTALRSLLMTLAIGNGIEDDPNENGILDNAYDAIGVIIGQSCWDTVADLHEAGTADECVKSGITHEEYLTLDNLISGYTGRTDIEKVETFEVDCAEVQFDMSMFDVTVTYVLNTTQNNVVSQYATYTDKVTLVQGATTQQIRAAIATKGIHAAAMAHFGDAYVDSQYVATNNGLPATLEDDYTYTVTYDPKYYTVNDSGADNFVAADTLPYGYKITLPVHTDKNNYAWDYVVNSVYTHQGTVLTVDKNLTISRTQGLPYDSHSLYQLICDRFGVAEYDLLSVRALTIKDETVFVRYPEGNLITVNGRIVSADTYYADYDESLIWKPVGVWAYDEHGNRLNDEAYPVNGAGKAEVEVDNFDYVKVDYELELTNITAEKIAEVLNLAIDLKNEAAAQRACMDILVSNYEYLEQLNASMLNTLYTVAEGSDCTPATLEALAALKSAQHLDSSYGTNGRLYLTGYVAAYMDENEGGLWYYYRDGNWARIRDEVTALHGYLATVLTDPEILDLLEGAGYGSRLGDLQELTKALGKAEFTPSNEVIDLQSNYLSDFIAALESYTPDRPSAFEYSYKNALGEEISVKGIVNAVTGDWEVDEEASNAGAIALLDTVKNTVGEISVGQTKYVDISVNGEPTEVTVALSYARHTADEFTEHPVLTTSLEKTAGDKVQVTIKLTVIDKFGVITKTNTHVVRFVPGALNDDTKAAVVGDVKALVAEMISTYANANIWEFNVADKTLDEALSEALSGTLTEDITLSYSWTEICWHQKVKTATCVSEAICEDCGQVRGPIDPNNHDWSDWTFVPGDLDNHSRTCGYGCGTVDTAAHNWTVFEEVPATCTADGHITYACTGDDGCRGSYTEVLTAIGHDWGEYVSNDDATCFADGTETRTCANDSNHKETRVDVGSQLTHSFTNYVSNGDATCEDDGYKTAYCDHGCGTTDTILDEGSALGHSFTNYVSNGDATCTADGTETAECDHGCGETHTRTEVGSALGHIDAEGDGDHTCDRCGTEDVSDHDYGNATCDEPATCSECGLSTGEPIGHTDWNRDHICDRNCGKTDMGTHADSADDNDHVCDYGCGEVMEACSDEVGDGDHNCDICGETVSDHTYSDATCEDPETCTECGETRGEALGHIDDNRDHICDRGCGKSDMGTHADSDTDNDHVCDYGCGEVMNDCSDVTGDGDHNCDICGEADVTGHTYSEPTCLEPATCTECGETSGEALGHDFEHGTWIDCGDFHTLMCSRCDVIDGNEYEHVYDGSCEDDLNCTYCGHLKPGGEHAGAWVDNGDGTHTRTCTVCGEVETASHEFSEWTFVDENVHSHVCTLCGCYVTASHNWDAGVETTPPSYTTEGEITYTCSDCNGHKYESVAVLVPESGIDNVGFNVMNSNTTIVLKGDNYSPRYALQYTVTVYREDGSVLGSFEYTADGIGATTRPITMNGYFADSDATELLNAAIAYASGDTFRIQTSCLVIDTYDNLLIDFVKALDEAAAGALDFSLVHSGGKYVIVANVTNPNALSGCLTNLVLTFVNDGYSYMGVTVNNGGVKTLEPFMSEGMISLQALVDALLCDDGFGLESILTMGENGPFTPDSVLYNGGVIGNLLQTAEMHLGGSASNIQKVVGFYLTMDKTISDERLEMANKFLVAETLNGELFVELTLPEKAFEVCVALMLATGEIDKTEVNTVTTAQAFAYLYEYLDQVLSTDADLTTFENTLAKLGRSYDLSKYVSYYQTVKELLTTNYTDAMGGDVELTLDLDVDNAKGVLYVNANVKSLLDSLLASSNMSGMETMLSVVKEYGANLPLTVTARLEVAETKSTFEVAVIDIKNSSMMNVVDFAANAADRISSLAGPAAVMLQSDIVGDLHFEHGAILDLNGFTVDGNITADATLIIIDSGMDTAAAGTVTGTVSGANVTILGGNYASDVTNFLKEGYVQENGTVRNEIYTIVKDAAGNITFEVSADVLAMRTIPTYMLAADIAADLALNYFTTAALAVGGNGIYDVTVTDLIDMLDLVLSNVNGGAAGLANAVLDDEDRVNQILGIIKMDAANDTFGGNGIEGFINQMIADALALDVIAGKINANENVFEYTLTTKPWQVEFSHVVEGDYVTASIVPGDATEVTLAVKVVGSEANKSKIANELLVLDGIIVDEGAANQQVTGTYAEIDLNPLFINDGLFNITAGGAFAVELDLASNFDYAVVLGIILAYGDSSIRADMTEAVIEYYETHNSDAIKALFNAATVGDLINAVKVMDRNTSFKNMADIVGVLDALRNHATLGTDALNTAISLENSYHAMAIASGALYERINNLLVKHIGIDLDNLSVMDKALGGLEVDDTGLYLLDKDNGFARAGSKVHSSGYGVEYDLTVEVLSFSIKIFCNHVDADNDHYCDICDGELSECADTDNDHLCDICGEIVSECADNDNDHYCDICGDELSECEDTDNDHKCDICGDVLSDCADDDDNHYCDICGEKISDCVDEDEDHICDICGNDTDHVDTDKDHYCDYAGCGEKISDCSDYSVTVNTDPNEHWDYCTYCGCEIDGTREAHDHSTEWATDADYHWHECECGHIIDKAEHTFIFGDDERICSVCDYVDCGLRVELYPFKDEHIQSSDLANTSFNTVGRVEAEMIDKTAGQITNSYAVLGSMLFEAQLEYQDPTTGEWIAADREHFPDDGKLPVSFPVPSGVEDPSKVTFYVAHMFSLNAFGNTAGELEFPVANVENGMITFYVTGLSPIMISWTCVEHVDADSDHFCDNCDEQLSLCVDSDNDHICDICGEPVSVCVDNDSDHICDICGEVISNCVDSNDDHKCDICGETISVCADDNSDHYCDICGTVISVCADDNGDHYCDVCGAVISVCVDNDSDHYCDICGERNGLCVDADGDHYCDVCGEEISLCEDLDNDHCCDICGAVISVCADNDNDHLCDICGLQISPCIDADDDHKCDICGEVISNCADNDNDHECDICGEVISNCVDSDDDHICDICGETISNCVDNDNDHECDICGEVISNCVDSDDDHICDICGEVISNCVDSDDDHLCDICGETVSVCADGDDDHLCDICGESVSVCVDGDDDHLCDICGESVSVCVDGDNDHKCDICGEAMSVCVDSDNDHNCDICGEAISVCVDGDNDHLCDICGETISVCVDNDNDHKCDICGSDNSLCVDANNDHLCDICGETISVCVDANSDHLCDICGETISLCDPVMYQDEDGHWTVCSICQAESLKENHIYGDDDICDVCGYEKNDPYIPPYIPPVEDEHCPSCEDDTCHLEEFSDLNPDLWYHEYVDYVLCNGLMIGFGNGLFAPGMDTTRAMIVLTLYRIEGCPEVDGEIPYTDVQDGRWYTDAILWATQNGIVEGFGNGLFAPHDPVTREQIDTIFYRYAKFKGMNIELTADISGYGDDEEVSAWAQEAVEWAVAVELMEGRSTTVLAPRDGTLRAETAALLYRWCEKLSNLLK